MIAILLQFFLDSGEHLLGHLLRSVVGALLGYGLDEFVELR